jgi:hypothetical protein
VKTIDSVFNVSFARAMAKRNAPERPEENNGYVNMPRLRRSQIEPKATLAANVAYTKAIQDYINDTRR